MAASSRRVALLFSGQGAQCVGMGQDIVCHHPAAAAVFEMGERLLPGITALCFSGEAEQLNRTENTQPALFLTDLAIAEAVRAAGVQPVALAGFSLGEIPAAAFAGVMSGEDAFRLVCLRGKSMAQAAEQHPGGMAAVLKLDASTVEGLCQGVREVWPVNYNCPGQISCAGCAEQIDALVAAAKEAGGRAVRLNVSGAFHTPYMQQVPPILADCLSGMELHAPAIPLYANLTGMPYPGTRVEISDTVSRQVCSPVRFEQTLRAMAAAGVDTFIEVGAGATLTGFVRRTLPDALALTVNDAAGLTAALAALEEETL